MPYCIFLRKSRKYADIQCDHINLDKPYDEILVRRFRPMFDPLMVELYYKYEKKGKSFGKIDPYLSRFAYMPIETADECAIQMCNIFKAITGRDDIWIRTYDYRKQKKVTVPQKKSYLYIMLDKNTGYIKIGISNNPIKRSKDLPQDIDLDNSYCIAGKEKQIRELETKLHRSFSKRNVKFDLKFHGHTEWFMFDSVDQCISEIEKIKKFKSEWIKIKGVL